VALSEFEIIQHYFHELGPRRSDVVCGVGDDAALLEVPAEMELAVSLDTLVSGVHFPADTPADAVGHKALAVGLSDLAAMGAEPAWFTLGLTLPASDEDWLTAFSAGLGALAARHGVRLVGGDLTRGALSVTIQVHGFVPRGAALLRRGARPGDRVYVTGSLGDAGLALRALRAPLSLPPDLLHGARRHLERPVPRVREGLALRGLAHAAIDVSDGLCADLGHILAASGVGATLWVDALPLSPALQAAQDILGEADSLSLALTAGDDYELCFTASPADEPRLRHRLAEAGGVLCPVGVIESRRGLRCEHADGRIFFPPARGYEHFSGSSDEASR